MCSPFPKIKTEYSALLIPNYIGDKNNCLSISAGLTDITCKVEHVMRGASNRLKLVRTDNGRYVCAHKVGRHEEDINRSTDFNSSLTL